jgi:hypothetical protein
VTGSIRGARCAGRKVAATTNPEQQRAGAGEREWISGLDPEEIFGDSFCQPIATLGAPALLLTLIVLAAAVPPLRRALRVSAAIALRAE